MCGVVCVTGLVNVWLFMYTISLYVCVCMCIFCVYVQHRIVGLMYILLFIPFEK